MQTTLLGLALALIAAILAAFAAPFFIDWNQWRPELEAQASALAGSRVTISGKIDLTLLPTPAFVLRNVSVGDAEHGTGMRASEMRGSLALPALLSGRIEADQFVVSRPAIRIAIGKDGALVLPAGSSAGQELSVSGFVFEAGSLIIEDRRTNSLLLADDFSARGELIAREGPFRLDGGFRLNGMRWILRASSGRFNPDHSGKVRLSLERPADAFTFEAEGLLSLANAALRFEGKLAAAQKSGALHWGFLSDATGNVSELQLANLELSLGEGDVPITLSGEAKLQPYAGGLLELILSSKRIDLDLGDQKAAATGAAHVLPWLSRVRDVLTALPVSAQISISADGVLAGGQLARDVRAHLRVERGVVLPERLEARLPGRAAVNLAGKYVDKKFAGPFSFQAEEPRLFARWLLGPDLAGKLALPAALALRATLDVALDGNSLGIRELRGDLGGTQVSGDIRRFLSNQPHWITEASLTANDVDLDTLLPVAKGALAVTDDELRASLIFVNARYLKIPVNRIALEVRRPRGQDFNLASLAVDDFDGLSLKASRSAGNPEEMEFSAEVVRDGGLLSALQSVAGSPDFARIVTRYAAPYFPLRLSGSLAKEKGGWRALLKSGDAQLSLRLGERRDGKQLIDGSLRFGGSDITGKGELRFAEDGRFEPSIALNFAARDLRKALPFAGRVAADALPISGSAMLSREDNAVVFEKLAFAFADTKGSGRLAFPVGNFSSFSGEIAIDKASAAALVALALGRAQTSYVELGPPLLANFPGTLKLEIGALAISERLAVQKAALRIRSGRYETVFEDFQGQFAGGKLSGLLRVADTFPRVLEIRLQASDVALAQVLPAKALRGTLRGELSLGASGNTQDDLLASIAGQGNVSVTALELDRTDATSVAAVFNATKDAPDEQKIEQALLAALARGPLKVSRVEAPLVIANGIFRSGSAKAKAGDTEISLSGAYDLPKRSVDALLSIEVIGKSSVRPGAILRWQGPLDAPERKLDARALVTAITLRAIERGGDVPPNLNVPKEDREPPARKARTPSNETDAVPPLPPPSNVLSVPQPRQPQIQN